MWTEKVKKAPKQNVYTNEKYFEKYTARQEAGRQSVYEREKERSRKIKGHEKCVGNKNLNQKQ